MIEFIVFVLIGAISSIVVYRRYAENTKLCANRYVTVPIQIPTHDDFCDLQIWDAMFNNTPVPGSDEYIYDKCVKNRERDMYGAINLWYQMPYSEAVQYPELQKDLSQHRGKW